MTTNTRGSTPADTLDGVDYLPERCATCQRVYTTFTCDHKSGVSPDDEREAPEAMTAQTEKGQHTPGSWRSESQYRPPIDASSASARSASRSAGAAAIRRAFGSAFSSTPRRLLDEVERARAAIKAAEGE